MTDPTDDPAIPAAFSLVLTEQEQQDSCRHTIRRLCMAKEAMQLALTAADGAVSNAYTLKLTPAQMFVQWHAANQLIRVAFDHLRFEVANSLDVMRQMLPPR